MVWVPPYTLNARQCRLYRHRVDLYVPSDPSNIASDQEADVSYPQNPTYHGVPCYFLPEGDIEQPTIEGRNKPGNIFTLGKFHFHSDQDIDDTYAIHFMTKKHPLFGVWFFAQGLPTVIAASGGRDTNTAIIFAKRGPNPFAS